LLARCGGKKREEEAMGIFAWLGLAAPEDTGPERTEVVERIGAALAGVPPERARVIAAFAYLLGRVAHSDHDLTPEETSSMVDHVVAMGQVSREEAQAVVAIAEVQSHRFRGTEDFRVTQEFGAIASDEEKAALLRCLFAVSAADSGVVTAEDNEIRRISQELKIPHAEFIAARQTVRARLAVLQRPAPSVE
jgi:uncharacterized tellurite resistance protein B-like protein